MSISNLTFILALNLIGFIFFLFLISKNWFMFWTSFGLGAFCILFILALGGGGVINDAYERLEKFERLEEAGLLIEAKNHPEKYDGMFRIDLGQFKNSLEFKKYIESHETLLKKFEIILTILSGVLVASFLIRLGTSVYTRVQKIRKKDAA